MSESVPIEKSKNAVRNSAFEILRIIAILLIIFHHFSVHGGFDYSLLDNSPLILFNRIWIDFIYQFGKAGVNLFILISGYFLVTKKTFKCKKALGLLIQGFVFSLIIGTIFFFAFQKEFSVGWLLKTLLPTSHATWWFLGAYLILYICYPLLNILIKHMGEKFHFILVVTLIVAISILPTFMVLRDDTSIIWFFTLYFVAAYIRLYGDKWKLKPVIGISIAIALIILCFSLKWILYFNLDLTIETNQKIIEWFSLNELTNFFHLVATLLIFISFKNIKMKGYKSINFVAGFTLAIYLFHDHPDMRTFLWKRLFNNAAFATSPGLVPYTFFAVLSVFIVSLGVGIAYQYSIEKLVNKGLDFLDNKFLHYLDFIFMLGRKTL